MIIYLFRRDLAHLLNCSELPFLLFQITLCLLTSIHLQINSKKIKKKKNTRKSSFENMEMKMKKKNQEDYLEFVQFEEDM
jgi:hypothetical protein